MKSVTLTLKTRNSLPIEASPKFVADWSLSVTGLWRSKKKKLWISSTKNWNISKSLDQGFIWTQEKLLKRSFTRLMMNLLIKKLWNPSPIEALPPRTDKTPKIALRPTHFLRPLATWWPLALVTRLRYDHYLVIVVYEASGLSCFKEEPA